MTPRKRKPPTETIAPPEPATEWDAADAEWAKEHAGPESLPLPFDDSEEKTAERPPFEMSAEEPVQPRTHQAAFEDALKTARKVSAADRAFTSTLDNGLKVTTEWVAVPSLKDQALAIIDEYVTRHGSGVGMKLDALLELRARVSKL